MDQGVCHHRGCHQSVLPSKDSGQERAVSSTTTAETWLDAVNVTYLSRIAQCRKLVLSTDRSNSSMQARAEAVQVCKLRWPDSRESIRRFARIACFSRIVTGFPNWTLFLFANRASRGLKLRIAGLRRFARIARTLWLGKSKWGLSKWGLKVLVHNCPRLPTIVIILWRKFPLKKGPKRPQKCTIVDDCVQIAKSGLKPPFESPHLDFPNLCCNWGFSAHRFARIGSRESPRFALRIAGPSKSANHVLCPSLCDENLLSSVFSNCVCAHDILLGPKWLHAEKIVLSN